MGSTCVLPMFINQLHSRISGEITDAQFNANRNNPGKIILVASDYQYIYATDGTHLTIQYLN